MLCTNPMTAHGTDRGRQLHGPFDTSEVRAGLRGVMLPLV